MGKYSLLIVSLGLSIAACHVSKKSGSLSSRYERAVQDAMYPTDQKIDTNLVSINESNTTLKWKVINGEKYIMVVTWKAANYYPDSGLYNTKGYEIWVTTAPQLLQRINQYRNGDKISRLKQMLGLPPTASYNYFIEFWVRPSDLFRPCPDKDVSDGRCNTCFTHADSSDPEHIRWINNFRLSAYYSCGLYNKYPWTELGYTYDWYPRNKRHIGLSEFVIGRDKSVYVNHVYRNEEYLARHY